MECMECTQQPAITQQLRQWQHIGLQRRILVLLLNLLLLLLLLNFPLTWLLLLNLLPTCLLLLLLIIWLLLLPFQVILPTARAAAACSSCSAADVLKHLFCLLCSCNIWST